jgi:hypothetical protein
MRTVLENKYCINQEVLVYYLAACDIWVCTENGS